MTNREKITPEQDDALNKAQVQFLANPLLLAPQTAHLAAARARVFEEVEKFSTGWLERRQEATRAMIETAGRVWTEGATNPARAMQEVADWQAGAMERMAKDAKDCTEMMIQCGTALVTHEIEAAEETAEISRKATKTSQSEPV